MPFDRAKVFAHIDKNINQHIAKVQELVRQPSISPESKGVRDCAKLVLSYLTSMGCKGELEETAGNPVVYGRYDAGAEKTIVVYMMYDTMPVDEPGWKVEPLAGTLTDVPPFGRCLVARGAFNTKGELRGFLNACESIIATRQKLPVNLLFLVEGEEELGSRHLADVILKHEKELQKTDAVLFPFASQDRTGKVVMYLGVKGIVYFELELDGATWGKGPKEFGIHGSHKGWIDSPAWRMIQALSTMTGPDGNKVTIQDFYRHVQVPNKEDKELLPGLEKTFNEAAVKEELKVDRFIGDSKGSEALKKYLFDPTLNINGIVSGYTGPETKTLLPHKITVKMDVRLVPNMRKDDTIPMIRNHLDAYGFKDVQIRVLEAGYTWSRTSYQSPPAQAVINSYKEMGKEVELWPTIAGSAPFSMFNRKPLNLPVVIGGLGHGALSHSPNEYLVIDEKGPTGGLASMEKSFVAILDNFGKMSK